MLTDFKLCFVLWFILGLLYGTSGFVVAGELPSVVSIDAGGDANGSIDGYLNLDYGFESGPRLLLFLGSNRSDNQDNPIVTDTSLLGLHTNPLETVSAGIEVEHWGEEGTLTTDTQRVVFDVNMESWALSLRPQWRTLTLTTVIQEIKVDSTGVAVDVNYFTKGPWGFSLGYVKHEYDSKIELIRKYPVLAFRRLSAATLELVAGFEDYRSSAGVSYASRNSLWDFSYLKSVSKVTGLASFISILRFSTNLDEHWRLSLRAGSQANEDNSESVGFAGAGFAYSW